MEPVPSGDTKSSSGLSQTGGTRKYLSRSCKPGANPKTIAHRATVTVDKKQLNSLTANLNFDNIFCALTFITFAAMITQGDPEWILPVTYVPSEPLTRRQAMNGQEREDWLEAEAENFNPFVILMYSQCVSYHRGGAQSERSGSTR